MRRNVIAWLLLAALLVPGALAAQTPAPSFRPFLHVFVAFAVAWVMVAVWVFQIGRKVRRIADQLDGVASE